MTEKKKRKGKWWLSYYVQAGLGEVAYMLVTWGKRTRHRGRTRERETTKEYQHCQHLLHRDPGIKNCAK
jgi:hypothetical protein